MTTASFSATVSPRIQAIAAVKRLHCPPPNYTPPEDVRGKLTCPKCGSTVTYFVRSINGLSTGNCAAACGVRWAE
jgi:hypothetical protein